MSYNLLYHPLILKEDVPELNRDILGRIKKAIEERLSIAPEQYGLPLRKTLFSYWKQRVGDYRIVYRVQKQEIHILAIAHRSYVYKLTLTRIPF